MTTDSERDKAIHDSLTYLPIFVGDAVIMLLNGAEDGSHHKMWVIDQALRILTESRYESLITAYKSGVDGPDTYSWDEGTPA